MKITYGIYDTHLNEWVVEPIEMTSRAVSQLDTLADSMNVAHDRLPARYRLPVNARRYRVVTKITKS